MVVFLEGEFWEARVFSYQFEILSSGIFQGRLTFGYDDYEATKCNFFLYHEILLRPNPCFRFVYRLYDCTWRYQLTNPGFAAFPASWPRTI